MQDVQAILSVGTLIRERYLIKSLIGKGNSGAVYLVEDQGAKQVRQKMRALKDIIGLSQQERYAFTFNSIQLRRIHHQSLPRIYHVFNDDKRSRLCTIMDYVDGPDLETLCQHQPEQHFTWLEVAHMMPAIVDAVTYLHQQEPPIVHGDIKPVNILLAQPEVKFMLVDIGVAREQHSDTDSSSYKAPEQNGKSVDARTDVYGLGATMYTLLTGVLPTAAYMRVAQLEREQVDPLKPANTVVAAIPSHVSHAIYRSMSIRADERFSSVEEFWEALQNPLKELKPPVDDFVSPATASTVVDSSTTKQEPGLKVTIKADHTLNRGADSRASLPNTFSREGDRMPTRGIPTPATAPHLFPPQPPPRWGRDGGGRRNVVTPLVGAMVGLLQKVSGRETLNRGPNSRATARVAPTLNRGADSRATARVAPTLYDAKRSPFFFVKGRFVAMLLVVLLLLVGIGAGIWSLAQNYQGTTTITKPAGTTHHPPTTPELGSTAPIVTPTSSPGSYPSVVGSYTGTLVDIPTKGSAPMILQGIHQIGGTINGFLTLGKPLAMNGLFSGTIDFSKQFQFIVIDAAGHPLLFIEGSIQTATSLSGDFYRCASASKGGTCLRASGDYGIWNAQLVRSNN